MRAYKISFMSYGTIIDGETEDKAYAFDILLESGFKKEYKNITSIGISGGYLFSSIVGYQSQLIFSNFGKIGLIVNKNPNCATFPIIAANKRAMKIGAIKIKK